MTTIPKSYVSGDCTVDLEWRWLFYFSLTTFSFYFCLLFHNATLFYLALFVVFFPTGFSHECLANAEPTVLHSLEIFSVFLSLIYRY